jgi:alpha-L-fucosidase
MALLVASGDSSFAQDRDSDSLPYEATSASLGQHPVPTWFEDAKLGIFIHWGVYSVPGWAPTSAGELGEVPFEEWFANNSYAEWYLNTMQINDSPTQRYHQDTYGGNVDYYDFAETFNEEVEKWDPDAMAALFSDVGARYVVLTSKHHDGFTLWPSRVDNPHLPAAHQGAQRDLVGELADAVRARDMRFGVYYSGGVDWSFKPTVITNLRDLVAAVPTDSAYTAYADAHWRELIDRYKPAVLWNDIAYPSAAKRRQLFADYYNAYPEGLVNNRWSTPTELQQAAAEGGGLTNADVHADFTTPEYAQYESITPEKWESTRGVGHSFGYNRNEGLEDMLTVDELVDSFVDIVSKNGNLLLNVGPKADGTIPAMQAERLRGLGNWLAVNGEAIFETRPWVEAEGKTSGGIDVRFTQKDGTVYAVLLDTPAGSQVVIENLHAAEDAQVELLGHGEALSWQQNGRHLVIELPGEVSDAVAHALRIRPTPWRLTQ